MIFPLSRGLPSFDPSFDSMFGLYHHSFFGWSDFMVEKEMHAHIMIITSIISQDECIGYSDSMTNRKIYWNVVLCIIRCLGNVYIGQNNFTRRSFEISAECRPVYSNGPNTLIIIIITGFYIALYHDKQGIISNQSRQLLAFWGVGFKVEVHVTHLFC